MNKEFNIKNTGFKIPKDYFDGVEDSVFSSLREEQLKGKTGAPNITVPEGYFESIEHRVMAKINKPEPKVIQLNYKRVLWSAASIAAILMLYFVMFNKTEPITLDTIDTELVEAYILEQDVNSYDLASLLTEDDLERINMDILEEEFTNDELEEYILDNIELETILEQ